MSPGQAHRASRRNLMWAGGRTSAQRPLGSGATARKGGERVWAVLAGGLMEQEVQRVDPRKRLAVQEQFRRVHLPFAGA